MDTYPYGYAGARKTMEQIEATSTWRNSHPELQRRMKAMMIASNGTVGPGTMWRSPAAQDAERARRLATGTGAQMAPSSRSWHCAGGAIDVVGNQQWAKDNCHHFGLYYATWAGESLWHQQIVGMPHARPTGASVNQFVGHHEIVNPPVHVPEQAPPSFPPFDPAHGLWSLWPLAPNKPVVRIGFHGDAAKYAQGVLRLKALRPVVVDGNFGPQSSRELKVAQRFLGMTPDGWIGPQTWRMIDMLAGR